MRRLTFALSSTLLALLSSVALGADPAKTGPYETQFTTRSPLSEMKPLAARLGLKPAPTQDYDLSTIHFHVYVPEAYDPAKPMGLLVLVNYKPSDTLPGPVLPQLADLNMAFVVSREMPDVLWERAGLALDAVHNLRQQYAIDPKRIYIMGAGCTMAKPTEPTYEALRLGLNAPEVFTGTITMGITNYHPFRAANGGMYPASLPPPSAKALSLAQQHPMIIALTPPSDESWMPYAKSYATGGFKHTKITTITLDQYHYPNYTTDWLADDVKFLDETTATLKLPTTKPTSTTKPTTAPAK